MEGEGGGLHLCQFFLLVGQQCEGSHQVSHLRREGKGEEGGGEEREGGGEGEGEEMEVD